MRKVSLKKNFKDGDKLFAEDLNGNFSVIEEDINSMDTDFEASLEEAKTELQEELKDITKDRGWDWSGSTTDRVTFFKGNTEQVESNPVKNGQLSYNVDTGETALDDNGKRIVTGSGNVVAIDGDEPANPSTKIWIQEGNKGPEDTMKFRSPETGEWKEFTYSVAGDTLPIGSITVFSSENIPANWLKLDGRQVSRTEYSELFAVIGTTYGEGDGATTFNLPDFRGKTAVGKDEDDPTFSTFATTVGEKTHKLTANEIPPAYLYPNEGLNAAIVGGYDTPAGGSQNYLLKTGLTNSSSPKISANHPMNFNTVAHNNIQPSLVSIYIIKAKQSVGVVGNVVTNMEEEGNGDVPNTTTVKEYVETKISETKPKMRTASNGWTCIDFGEHQRYFRNGSFSQTFNSSAWGNLGTAINLPTEIGTFNATKMDFSMAMVCDDNAISLTYAVGGGARSVTTSYRNSFGGNVTSTVRYNAVLTTYNGLETD